MGAPKEATIRGPHLLQTLQRQVFHCSWDEFKLLLLAFWALCGLAQCISPDTPLSSLQDTCAPAMPNSVPAILNVPCFF